MTPLAAECSLVETGLRASAFIYSETRKRVREKDEHVPIEDLKAVKKAALDVNQVGTRFSNCAQTTHTHTRALVTRTHPIVGSASLDTSRRVGARSTGC